VLVAPERWRLGIGRTLTQAGIEWAREMGYGAVVLETTTEQKAAAALYESLNFANSARSKYGAYEIMWFTLVL
jgi:ribosomal protein S18 acetylase RimI-like enzyme